MFGRDASASSRPMNSNPRGFLLLETLLAVLILTVGLTFMIRSLGSSLGALRASDDATQAMLLLEERMWDLEAEGSITPGSSRGAFPKHDGKYQWAVEASEPNDLGLCETKVTVSWKQKGRHRDVSVVTYFKTEEGGPK